MKQILIIMLLATLSFGAAKTDSARTQVHVVRIDGMKFIPKSLEVKLGETVRWINESDMSHNVIANDGSFKSDMLDRPGDKFEYTFDKEGTFHYYCQPHRIMGMKGTLIVKK